MRVAALICIFATPVVADPMTGAEFAAYTAGKTLAFAGPDGTLFGIEEYLADQRVLWSATPGQCLSGTWSEVGQSICFTYDGDPLPKCWEVSLTDKGLRAVSPQFGTLAIEAQETTLTCTGPDLLS